LHICPLSRRDPYFFVFLTAGSLRKAEKADLDNRTIKSAMVSSNDI